MCLSLFLSYPSVAEQYYMRVFSQAVTMEDDIYIEDVSLAIFCGLIPSYFSSIQILNEEYQKV